jgi:hypothetical protein
VGNYDRLGEVTDDNIIRQMRFACWVNKAADTHSACITFLDVDGKYSYAGAPQY